MIFSFNGCIINENLSEFWRNNGLSVFKYSSCGRNNQGILRQENKLLYRYQLGFHDNESFENGGLYFYRIFADVGAIKSFSTLGAAYAEVCQIVARADSGIKTVADLKGKKVSVGDSGSGVEFNAQQILGAYGITFDDIDKQNLSFQASADALKDGKIDAFFCTAGAPTVAITDLSTTTGIVLVEIDAEHLAALQEDYGFYAAYTVPAGTYNGIDADVTTVAVKATFIVSNDLDEETVYQLTKAIYENKDEYSHEKAAEMSIEYAVSSISVPFHPGAERYFKEVGAIS